ncbi:ABC transporter permease [Candidatus Pseudothioglobus singularis]|jgi:peptide/nickel transport system permease protein|nr:ABC transporter permease [Candidatus Pseudothioglobus singularis]MDA8755567.1 ABC transporter permease [Candidatus Pseudothioglobus singularis]MDB4821895.1 ABC transporter permease [Candidatus Pseudothioglobus singularis]MDC0553279.1 ABC transporter permease [Candidatus Pseudothioglobus singularis]MDC0599135.1 ABC transporter permease [Candidatus Pseudothioglobus singularis]MDC0964201.1 ABC transporter permease [Candidatus Pseudothioglobus singularis]|tara:strand:+ start:313 stop:1149 length:837 start_codon:yes stop_codon:yes gene_type:complete
MKGVIKKISSDPLGLIGLCLVTLMVISALGAPIFAPYDPIQLNIMERLQGPSVNHLLGTDQLGRDLFSRVLFGGQVALKVAFLTIGLALIVGIVLGLIAGYGPAWLDNSIMLLFDTIRSVPTIMLALAAVTVVGPSITTVIFVVAVSSIPNYGRIVRTQTLTLKSKDFVKAEKLMGASLIRILSIHLLPNILGPLLILASMDIPTVIALEAGLSFLGMGVKPPTPSWGSILNDGFTLIRNTPWPIIAGSIPLVLATLGFTFLGESLRDLLDPKLRKLL